MTQPSTVSAVSPLEDVLGQLALALQGANDFDKEVRRFVDLHPEFAEAIRGFAGTERQLRLAARSAPSDELEPGRRLGPFRIVRFVARGGMGEIYEAEQVDLKRSVALKVIRPDKANEEMRGRFAREREVLAKLHQTHIVPVFASGEEDGLQFYAMHFIRGAALSHVVSALRDPETLRARTTSTPGLGELAGAIRDKAGNASGTTQSAPSPAETVRTGGAAISRPRLTAAYFRSVAEVLADAADALQAAHDQGVCHRDLKPSNLMVEPSGKCWLIDFGLAALPSDSGVDQQPAGTPEYMAPEAFECRGDKRLWDVWGLGATLYELLTLRPPLDRVRRSEDPPMAAPRAVDRRIPGDLEAICLNAMNPDPSKRYSSPRAMANDLRRWLAGVATAARPNWITLRPVRLWAWRNKAWATAIAVAVMGLVAILVGEVRRAEMERRKADAERRQADAERLQEDAERRQATELRRGAVLTAAAEGRLGSRTFGWSERSLQKVREAAEIRADGDTQKIAVATFAGLDARLYRERANEAATWLAFDQTGRRVLLGGYRGSEKPPKHDQPTRLWNIETDTVEATSTQDDPGPVGFRGDVPVHLVPPTPKRNTLLLWDVAQNKLLEEFQLPPGSKPADPGIGHDTNQHDIVLSADGTHIALSVISAEATRSVLVWAVGTAPPCCAIPVAASGTTQELEAVLAFSPDNRLLAVGSEDGDVTVWMVPGAEKIATFAGDRARICSLAFARDPLLHNADRRRAGLGQGWLLATGSAWGTVRVWDLETQSARMTSRGSHYEVLSLAFDPTRTILATAGRSLQLFDIGSGAMLLNGGFDGGWISDVRFAPDGGQLALSRLPVFSPPHLEVFKLNVGRDIRTLRGLVAPIIRDRFSRDDKRFGAIAQNFQAAVWDLDSGKLRLLAEIPKALYADHADLAFSPDGSRFVVASGVGAVMWEVETGRVLEEWPLNPALSTRIAFHLTGKLLAYRTETRSGKSYPHAGVPPEVDPRVCRVVELASGGMVRAVSDIADYPLHIEDLKVPADGTFVVVNGYAGKRGQSTHHVSIHDGLSGKLIKQFWPPGPLDSSGTVMAVGHREGRDMVDLLKMPSAEPVGQLVWTRDTRAFVYGPKLRRRCVDDLQNALLLFDDDEKEPFLSVIYDSLLSSTDATQFNSTGDLLAWGARDGTVMVCDIEAVRRRLRGMGLGR